VTSEQSEKPESGLVKRWTAPEARQAPHDFQESGLRATTLAANKGISPMRLPHSAERLGGSPTEAVDIVAVPLLRHAAVKVERH